MKDKNLLLLYVRFIGEWEAYDRLGEEDKEAYLKAIDSTFAFATFCTSKAFRDLARAVKTSLKIHL